MVTHDNRMAQHAKRIIRMKDGVIETVEKVGQPLRSALPVEVEQSLQEVLNETL